MATITTASGAAIHYLDAGRGDRAVLFVHGNLGCALWWRKTLAALPAGLRGFAIDLPGSGASPETGERHTMEYLAGVVAEVVDELRLERFDLVGHSMGGGVCQVYAIEHGERVRRLVLVDSMAMDGFHVMAGYPEERLRRLREDRDFLRRALAVVAPRCDDPAFFEEIVEAAWGASDQVFFEQPRTMDEASWADRIDRIRCPTLFLHGAEDDFVPKDGSERTAAAIPSCELRYLDHCGHSPMVEVPEVFDAALLAFLEPS